jgi:hypothetical protein
MRVRSKGSGWKADAPFGHTLMRRSLRSELFADGVPIDHLLRGEHGFHDGFEGSRCFFRPDAWSGMNARSADIVIGTTRKEGRKERRRREKEDRRKMDRREKRGKKRTLVDFS